MAVITYPLLTVADDLGTITSAATVAITSVKDKAGTDVASHGATVSQSGANVSVDYDAEAKGEAWIVLAVSKIGSAFTGLNAAPAFFLAKDSSRIALMPTAVMAAALPAPTAGKPTTLGGFIAWLNQRYNGPSAKDDAAKTIKVKADDGTTVLTTQAYTTSGASETTQLAS